MTKCMAALELAAQGFHVFRVKRNGKLPAYKGWQQEATRDPDQIVKLWGSMDFNIGIFTSKFRNNAALVVIDEDNKGDKKGADTILQLEFEGHDLPATATQHTPTGGKHHIYSCERPLKQGANVLGDGLDIRSRGGYILGAGSTIDGREYGIDDRAVIDAPTWLVERLGVATVREKKDVDVSKIDQGRALQRARKYLEDAPIAEEGRRNDTAFKVACKIKDHGVDEATCLELVTEWNEDNDPPLEPEEIEILVNSAYKTGQNAVGSKAPEAVFKPIAPPPGEPDKDRSEAATEEVAPEGSKFWFDELNEKFALVMAGGGHHILWETTDAEGKFKLEHLNEASFHKMLAYKTVKIGKKTELQTKVWLADKEARRFDALTFMPEREVNKRFYNMWRGFTVKPLADGEAVNPLGQKGFDMWYEHGLMNVCNGDKKLWHWQVCRLAAIIQKPWVKWLTSCVYRGEKGVGKNTLLLFVQALLGHHALLTSKKRYLTGNFNGHFESCLMFVLDEALWAGDKDAEGTLKDLITGRTHFIEHKGKEGYEVPNLTNVFIIGNNDWLVPASFDERRYAVFNVNNNRKQDTEFFETMKNYMMDEDGLRVLLTFLKNYKIDVNVNVAPQTRGLTDQKINSLEPMGQWWLDCLSNGELLGSGSTNFDWTEIQCSLFRDSLRRYLKERNVSRQVPTDEYIGREIKKMAPSMSKRLKRGSGNHYRSEGLAALRKDFEAYIKGEITWQLTEEDDAFQ